MSNHNFKEHFNTILDRHLSLKYQLFINIKIKIHIRKFSTV